jgi:hypothetical protein
MNEGKGQYQWWSLVGVIFLALILPGLLRLTNLVVRYVVGAEGRLAAIAVETDRPLGPLPAVWQGLAQGGDNLKGFLGGIEEKISTIKPAYIRIDHVYDEFSVVGRDNNGLTFDWAELDKTVNKILEVGALPFFSLSYMPAAISSSEDILAEPKNWDEWAMVVKKTIEHYSGDLGLENVYYEVWNEPDLFGKWSIEGKKDYRKLYLSAATGAQQASGVKPFKIGGPATTGLYKGWVDNFFPYILKDKVRLDFYSWHRYDLDLNKYIEDVENVDKWIEAYPYLSHTEKVISEMGPTSELGRENDTQIGAAHLVATARELMYKVRYGFNFAVSGNWGIMGKPRYEALKLLSKLGETRLSITGEGSWVRAIGAKDGNKYQVLLVNYDPKEVHSEVVPVSFLGLQQRNYWLRKEILDGGKSETEVATSEAILQTSIPMTANTVVLVELEPIVK